jgi:hypothetical protein
VTADRSLKALADRHPGDLHALAGLELPHGQHLAHLVLAVGIAELDQGPQRTRSGLLQVAELSLRQLALRRLAEGQLDRGVAVALRVADPRNRAGTGLDHRHGHASPVLGEHLSHAELLADQRRHITLRS